MRIPKRFKLMGRTIEVVERHDLLQERDWTGAACYSKNQIELLPHSDIYQMADTAREQTFCHEFAHWLMYLSGGAVNYDLKSGGYIHKNEEFIDLLGGLIQQALSTMEYDG
jgi:predicted SprT family Zn-dependent metalloprotease